VLEDRRAGYRLDLRIDNVRQSGAGENGL
jgi:hypothetical protein